MDEGRDSETTAPAGSAGGGPDPAETARFETILFARAPAEDMADVPPALRHAAAGIALDALTRHQRGSSVVAVRSVEGRTLVTAVNENMPFLFDSVLGEIAERAGEPKLVLHPVLHVRRGPDGTAIVADGRASGTGPATASEAAGGERVSLIQVHLALLPPAEAAGLGAALAAVLAQVRAAVADWKPMLDAVDGEIAALAASRSPLEPAALAEARAFLEWLRADNFTFLGIREFRYEGGEADGRLTRAAEPGLGILRDPDLLILRRDAEGSPTTPEIRAFLTGPEPLIVTKANTKSRVHRRVYLDYVGVKRFAEDGRLAGELRLVGLFTSTAYTRSVFGIPFLRAKAQAVLAAFGFSPTDHSGKALVNVLESYPRDELFQVDVPTLIRHAEAILALGERPRVRALVRLDPFDRFVSVIVFVPRDRYDSTVRERIGDYLKTAFEGRVSAFYPAFPEGSLARVHFIIGRSGGKPPAVDPADIEAAARAIARTWEDGLRDAAASGSASAEALAFARRLPPAYRDTFAPQTGLADSDRATRLSPAGPIAIATYRDSEQSGSEAALKIFHLGAALELSRRVPLLENMGFRVISEQTFEVPAGTDAPVFIHDMRLASADGSAIDLGDGAARIEAVFLSVWRGEADNDGLNALAQTAGLDVEAIAVLRLYARYLQQAGIPQSQDFVAGVLNRNAAVAADLWAMFQARFDPSAADGAKEAGIETRILSALEAVPSLDDDTILRRLLALVGASLRTNRYAPGGDKRALAVKLDARALAFLPEPKPWREIFVHGPDVEGVHLRFGPVARGGLRWSDRAQDYRTEVLGLVKAQQVKNAVIVPVGAKGGFLPKRLPAAGGRDAAFETGRAAYVTFVSSLLSLTDDLAPDGAVVHPEGVRRHDGDDPYLVVAADKGTATFSDTANSIAVAHGFWLDDAFASGGSAGYDHKKMGITARGAWEAVKRHFREMNRDIETTPFTVAGVGDMSGDVFGNGMLLSAQTRLIAAFDHRDIFLDPDPDPAVSLAERRRLFELPRSSWQDYDRSKLSAGGAVVSRGQKSVELSPQAAAALGLAAGPLAPQALMAAILKAPVDLLWFGGIGTYVKASGEAHAEVGDRANDAVRADASELRAKVIGEGANLAVTQVARIEFGRRGGRCNSDAIDNSGGVNSSDLEVNIKIALSAALRAGRLDRPSRDLLLSAMTADVAALVLANNYGQTLAISLEERRGAAALPRQARFIERLEGRGLLDRTVEGLPNAARLAERQARGEGLTRAEISVLLAYAKITLFADLLQTTAPDDAFFADDLLSYFPPAMRERFADEIGGHRLRRDIVARVLVNDLVNRCGPVFGDRLQEAVGAGADAVVLAYAVARDGLDLPRLYASIDALDNQIDGRAQLDLYAAVGRVGESATAWLLRNGLGAAGAGEAAALLTGARTALEPRWAALLPPTVAAGVAARQAELRGLGAPDGLAADLAALPVRALVPEILRAAREADVGVAAAAQAYFGVAELLRIGRLEDGARRLEPADPFDAQALDRAMAQIGAARRRLAGEALRRAGAAGDAAVRVAQAAGDRFARTQARLREITESGEIGLSKLTVAAGLLGDLAASLP